MIQIQHKRAAFLAVWQVLQESVIQQDSFRKLFTRAPHWLRRIRVLTFRSIHSRSHSKRFVHIIGQHYQPLPLPSIIRPSNVVSLCASDASQLC